MNAGRLAAAIRHIGRVPEVWRCQRRLTGWTRITRAYVGLQSLVLPCEVRTKSGEVFTLQEFYDLETLWQVFCREVYSVDPSDRVIIDAGANIGLFACYAAAIAPTSIVHAIEPFPETFRRLSRTIERNHLQSRITCHNIALASTEGMGTMSAETESSQMFHLSSAASDVGTRVRTTTLTSLLGQIDAPVDLLKMDIEGSEYDVLLSTPVAALQPIGRITVEFHEPAWPSGSDKRTLADHICGAGFRLREDPAIPNEYGIFHFTKPLSPISRTATAPRALGAARA